MGLNEGSGETATRIFKAARRTLIDYGVRTEVR